jgi:hypothetical protein
LGRNARSARSKLEGSKEGVKRKRERERKSKTRVFGESGESSEGSEEVCDV